MFLFAVPNLTELSNVSLILIDKIFDIYLHQRTLVCAFDVFKPSNECTRIFSLTQS